MYKTDDFTADSENSAKIFDTIKPVLEQYFGGEIVSTENHTSQIDILLDSHCGIDAIVKTQNDIVFGIAHRVKYNDYTDFTIRTYRPGHKTEIDHMRQSGIKPRYHVQTVCLHGKPTRIAIARSMDLLYAIDSGLAATKTAYNGCKFAILEWNILIANGIDVDIINL